MTFYFVEDYWMYYLEGFKWTILLAFFAVIISIAWGITLALFRLSSIKVLSWFAVAYINFIRGTPLLVQIYLIYYGLSLNLPDYLAAVLALSVHSGAYIAEVVRAGIQAVDKGQMEAARSLGMTHGNAMRRIVVPQAIKNILPALCNEFIIIIKNTSLMSVIGISELMYNVDTIRGNTYLAFEPLIVGAIIYFITTYVLKHLIGILERRLKASD
ncbi:amino acid ABC transporter permease [Neobacillus niacini]|uniref:amino acid ABC transporter permease n=1 Tax=Neobacillus niacini TaxID=86668 RepID=UPI002FFDC496